MKKKIVYIIFPVLLVLFQGGRNIESGKNSGNAILPDTTKISYRQLYTEMSLDGIVNYRAFLQAIAGYEKIDVLHKGILTLIDYTKPSTEKRLYVLDIDNRKLLHESYVSHGRNSGGNFATSFSNENGSYKSSLGFFLTKNTYQGKNGYSLVLDGLEKGINDKAKDRAIVIHGAAYCDPSFISASGRLGRSLGCPALPLNICKPIINTIKEGSLVFIYANDPDYLTQSPILSTVSSHKDLSTIPARFSTI